MKSQKYNIINNKIKSCFILNLISTFSSHILFWTSVHRTRPMSLNMEPCMAGPFVCSLSFWLTASYVLLLYLLVSSKEGCTLTHMHSHTPNTFIISSLVLCLRLQPLPVTSVSCKHFYTQHIIYFQSLGGCCVFLQVSCT